MEGNYMLKTKLGLFDKDPETPETKDPIVDVEARIQAMLSKAQETADAIIKGAQDEVKKLTGKAKGVSAASPDEDVSQKKAQDAYLNEYVHIKLFKDNNKYKDDVFVNVNGENCVIQRGKDVMIKRKFYETIDQSLVQDAYAADVMTGLTDEYRNKEEHLK